MDVSCHLVLHTQLDCCSSIFSKRLSCSCKRLCFNHSVRGGCRDWQCERPLLQNAVNFSQLARWSLVDGSVIRLFVAGSSHGLHVTNSTFNR
jgi:hypothetical protein